jgi:hypothetical protein
MTTFQYQPYLGWFQPSLKADTPAKPGLAYHFFTKSSFASITQQYSVSIRGELANPDQRFHNIHYSFLVVYKASAVNYPEWLAE